MMESLVRFFLIPALVSWAVAGSVAAQPSPSGSIEENPLDTGPVQFDKTDMSGPRFGMTYVVGDGEIARQLDENDMGRALSQFGWHFERRVTPRGGGPQFVVEAIPLVAGVEYGKIVPNFTVAMGVRFPQGWEFGIGPNIFITGNDDSEQVQSSLITAIGYSFQYSGVSLPVNLALSSNPEGNRVSLVLGYAIRR